MMTPTGWTCPKCAAVYAPFVTECHRCNGALTVQETGATNDSGDVPRGFEARTAAILAENRGPSGRKNRNKLP